MKALGFGTEKQEPEPTIEPESNEAPQMENVAEKVDESVESQVEE